jgi:hypothetical protein
MNLLKQAQEKAKERMNDEFRIYSFERRMTDDELANTDEEDLEDGEPFTEAEPSDMDEWLDDLIKQVYEDVVHEVEGMKQIPNPNKTLKQYQVGHIDGYNQAIQDVDDILNKLKSE